MKNKKIEGEVMFSRNLVLMILALCVLCVSAACAPVSQADKGDGGMQAEVTEHFSVFTSGAEGFDTHSYYYDTGREVVVFGAQFTESLAEDLVMQIKAETSSPIRYLVITHPNPDKFNGVGVFRREGAKVVASEATAAAIPAVHAYKEYYFVEIAGMFTHENYPKEAVVDVTFGETLSLELEAGSVVLSTLEHSGVSTTQTVAWVESQGALVVGDLVHHKAHAWLEGGIKGEAPALDLASWKLALGELLAFEGATVYGGRGESVGVKEGVRAQVEYLDGVERLVREYVEGLGDARAELQGDKAGEHHKAISMLVAEAFPEYALPYMVEYSVYGLINQL